jgi:hypothetical protein
MVLRTQLPRPTDTNAPPTPLYSLRNGCGPRQRKKAAAYSRPTPPEALSPRRLPSLDAALALAGQAELCVVRGGRHATAVTPLPSSPPLTHKG